MTPAAMPDGPPSRKGPLCSVLSPLPALYFYCKNTPCPFLSKEIQKTRPALRPALHTGTNSKKQFQAGRVFGLIIWIMNIFQQIKRSINYDASLIFMDFPMNA